MHTDQIDLTLATARQLIRDQFPLWADEPIDPAPSSGTVNRIVRIGDGFAARFPLRAADPDATAETLRAEAAAADRLAALSPVPVPTVVGLGVPGRGYPLPWSVQTWVHGQVATSTSLASSVEFARDLAAFVAALRQADTRGQTFQGTNRGGDLRRHDEWVEECLHESRDLLNTTLLAGLWKRYRQLPARHTDVMSHTDLIPGNLVTHGQRLTGVLDVGGFGAADPALDLVAGWHLLADAARGVFREALGSDDLEWARGRAWAFEQALGAVWYYIDSNPPMHAMGAWTLHRIICDETADPGLLAPPDSRVWDVLHTPEAPASCA